MRHSAAAHVPVRRAIDAETPHTGPSPASEPFPDRFAGHRRCRQGFSARLGRLASARQSVGSNFGRGRALRRPVRRNSLTRASAADRFDAATAETAAKPRHRPGRRYHRFRLDGPGAEEK
jgi:hypothetical protein